MEHIDDLLQRLAAKRPTFSLYGPCSEAAIDDLESSLGVKLPKSYRTFLSRYGGGGPTPGISGIYQNDSRRTNFGTAYGDTVRTRRDFSIPADIVVIYRDESGAIWGLRTAQMELDGECPVVSAAGGVVQVSHRTFLEFLHEYLALRV